MHGLVSTLLALVAAGLGADEPTPAPIPSAIPWSRGFGVDSSLFVDAERPLSLPISDLHIWLQKLRLAREGLQEDRTQAAMFVHDMNLSESPDAAKLKERAERLLKTLKGPPSIAPTPPPQPKKVEIEPPPPIPVLPKPMQADPRAPEPPNVSSPLEASRAVEPLALGQALFRIGNYQGALKAYQSVSLSGLKAEERAPIQYMIATCLRKLDKTEEAAALYRTVANSRGDEQVAACAQMQLQMLRWHKESTERLAQIRERRLALERSTDQPLERQP